MTELMVALFLFLKTGEKFATPEHAGPTVAAFLTEVARQLGGGVKFEPHVMNDPIKAVEFVAAKKPTAGIVSPGFYLAYAKALGMEPLLETQRRGVPVERYVVVTRKDGPAELTGLKGKIIATAIAAEERYVVGVVLAGALGNEVRLKAVTDVEGAAFDLAAGAPRAAEAVLLEEAAWKVFAQDEELGAALKVVYTSADLPGNLVVSFAEGRPAVPAAKLRAALQELSGSEAGQAALASIRVEKFSAVDEARLAKARAAFAGTAQ